MSPAIFRRKDKAVWKEVKKGDCLVIEEEDTCKFVKVCSKCGRRINVVVQLKPEFGVSVSCGECYPIEEVGG
jgi:hypothetical protein